MDERLHIASLILYLRTRDRSAFQHWIEHRDDVEIALESPEGKLVLIAETSCHLAINGLLDELQNLPGVLNAVLVYHEELDAPSLPQATAAQAIRIVGES